MGADETSSADRAALGPVMRALLCVTTAIVAVSATGCSLAQSCEEQGCRPGVSVTAPLLRVDSRMLTVRACIDGVCSEEQHEPGRHGEFAGGTVSVPVPDTDEVAVHVTLIDADGRVVANAVGTGVVVHERPNGDDGPPECRIVSVRIDGSRLTSSTA